MKKTAFLILLCILVTNLFAQSPGGVSTNLRWWLKASSGTFTDNGTTAATDGQLVQQWNDQSTIANHARQTTNGNKPVYKIDIANGNPVLRFASDQFLDGLAVPGIAPGNNMHIFLVFKQNSYTGGGNDAVGTYIIDRSSATNNLASLKMVTPSNYFYQKRNDTGGNLTGPVTVTSAVTGSFTELSYYRNVGTGANGYGIYLNGRLDVTLAADNDQITGPILRIGRHATNVNGGLNGDLAEIILYNANLNNVDRPKIESYLALKYGITLDQTSATNYISSGGSVIYPATTTHDLYDMNIAGIGQDNTSGLLQTSSQSQNSQSIVKIFNPTGMTNNEFLMWGNDAPVIWNSNDIPSPYVNRISRVWRVAETGDVGNFDISFDLSGLGIDMTDPTKFALLTDANGVFNDATAHITGRSIVGNIVTFTGATINTNQYFSLACPLIPGPGGVAATAAWLRADEDVYTNAGVTLATNGQTVQQWNTRGGVTAANATQATGANKPTYITNAANGNPVVRFATSTFLDFGTLSVTTTSDLSTTVVFKPTAVSTGTIADNAGTYVLDRTTNTTPITSLKFITGNKIGFQERTDAGTVDGPATTSSVSTTAMQVVDFYRDYGVRFGIFYNGAQEATLAESGGALTFPTPRIGARQNGGNGLAGDIAEYIFYTRDITTLERNRIDSYLAIKYGITLDQATLTNYTASDGVVIYPATSSHSGYISDIAGIGKDVVSRLTQSNSISANTGAVVRVQSPSSLDDVDFFVWGDNGNALTSGSGSVDGTLIKWRLSRVWRVAERGDVGTISISFDLSGVPGAKVQADLRLMIDRDGDGFTDNDVTPLTGTLVGSVFTVTGVDLQNNDYLTIGTTNTATTPLPIELLTFDVSVKKEGVLAKWRTETEFNNDYFTLQRSLDGEKFVEASRVEGSGTTKEPQFYEALDNPGMTGDIYYRLKQTDFDGKTSFSDIHKVTLRSVPFFVKLYPNPVDGSEFTTEVPLENNEVLMEVINSAGQVVFSGTAGGPVTTWNVGELPKGIYFVKVLSNTGAAAQKVVLR